jgi:hypothetical protein
VVKLLTDIKADILKLAMEDQEHLEQRIFLLED